MFSAPLWLYALATLAIPLALHLWSRRPRDVIRVGSLRHVADSAEARSWSARLTQPILLLFRLAILASVVLALAGPRIAAGRLDGRVSDLVLVEPALLADSMLVRRDPLLDSLARSRATVRLLTNGLPRLQLDGPSSGAEVPRCGQAPCPAMRLWDLLLSADRLVSPGGTILVIARPRVTAMGGRRPALAAHVTWHVPAPAPPAEWLAGRWVIAGDSLLEMRGWGSSQASGYQGRVTARGAQGSPCEGCASPRAVSLRIESPDSALRRRLHVAALAVGSILGQPVELARAPDKADLLLTTLPLSDTMLDGGIPVTSISAIVAASPALADTVLAHWPAPPLAADPADPREVTLAQALPESRPAAPAEQHDARAPLLLLALLLFAVERFFSTRPRPAR